MTHIHWVERQNKLEIPKEKDEVNKREVHECDVRMRCANTRSRRRLCHTHKHISFRLSKTLTKGGTNE